MTRRELAAALHWIATRGPVSDETPREGVHRVLHARMEASLLAQELMHELGIPWDESLWMEYQPKTAGSPYRFDPNS